MFNLCKQKSKTTFFAAALCLLSAGTSIAGGPLIVGGANKITPIKYQNPNIVLNVESGRLGALSNADANTMLQDAFSRWNQVATSTMRLSIDTAEINTDINIDNYDSYIPNLSQTKFNADDGLNPVVYDDNGEIIDLLLGIGQSENTIGLAASTFTDQSDYFLEGYVILNGKDLKQTETVIKLLIIHEIGHFFGLDHSQLNINNQERFSGSPGLCRTASPGKYPVMYPYICRNTVTLHGDDISAVSALYPAANIDSEFGILQGHFVDSSGRGILGANLWFENTVTGEVYSIVSDYLKQGTGYYKIYLPAGKYTLHANSVNTIFYGGSGIGPYSEYTYSESFRSPHPIAEVTVQDGNSGNPLVIEIATNRTADVNFDLNGNTVAASFLSNAIASAGDGGGGGTGLLSLLALLTVLLFARRDVSRT